MQFYCKRIVRNNRCIICWKTELRANTKSDFGCLFKNLMESTDSGLENGMGAMSTEVDDCVANGLQVLPIECGKNEVQAASEIQPLTNWREVWDNYVDDCANRQKNQKRLKTSSDCNSGNVANAGAKYKHRRRRTINSDGNALGENNQQPTDTKKRPRRRRYKKTSKNPTEEHCKVLDSAHLWNLYIDFVHNNAENQQLKDSKRTPWWHTKKRGINNHYRRTAQPKAQSNLTQQQKSRHPLNPLEVDSIGNTRMTTSHLNKNNLQTISNGTDTRPKTTTGVYKKNFGTKKRRPTKPHLRSKKECTEVLPSTTVKHKQINKDNQQALIPRNVESSKQTPTPNWNYLWNLYLDFVHIPMGKCTIANHLTNNGALKRNPCSNVIDNTSETKADNWSSLWNLYNDFERKGPSKPFEYIAIDCEMVVGGGRKMLARVSIVDRHRRVVLDKFVKPTDTVTDYLTEVSGLRPEDLENGEDFELVRSEVSQLIRGTLICI